MTAVAPLEVKVRIPEAFDFLFDPPLGELRYRGAYGGRGSAKSWQVARALLIHGAQQKLRILCAREFQSSIADSVHKLLQDQMAAVGLTGFYTVTQRSIIGENGTEFLFKGLRLDVEEIKSTEGIDVCWIEEAQRVSDNSWTVLIPTIRKDGSEIWLTWNTGLETDPTHQRFVVNPPPRAAIRFVTFQDNPFLPQVLDEEQAQLLKTDPEAHATVWGGQLWRRSDAEVFSGKWIIAEFDSPRWIETEDPKTRKLLGRWSPEWDGPYFGADYGFANDPSVLVRMWRADGKLYIDREESGVKLDNDQLADLWKGIPGAETHTIRADAARPETTHEMTRRDLRVISAPKWEGSVKDGISHLRTYEKIIIHDRCKLAAQEARLYRYKTDPVTDDVLPIVVDKHNHVWDAVRYGLAPFIRQRTVGIA